MLTTNPAAFYALTAASACVTLPPANPRCWREALAERRAGHGGAPEARDPRTPVGVHQA
jgi:hypothetical protein